MSKLLDKIVNVSYPVVIAQYERDDKGVGHENSLHWSLLVIQNMEELKGPTFHAVDRTTRDGVTNLVKTSKCLGLVQIGSVKARDLKSFIELVGDNDQEKGHATIPKYPGWRCKEGVLEVIELLREQDVNWVDERILRPGSQPTRETFLPAMTRVARATVEARKSNKNAKPVAEWLE
ncbi:hypothetical protein C8R44DRAFT_744847 [Mycena epipterygia]|nr:hypothetical protein C8R44DRAFT_744847 [Mycena epipterygia]